MLMRSNPFALGILCQKYGIGFQDLQKWCHDSGPLPFTMHTQLKQRKPGQKVDIGNLCEYSQEMTMLLSKYCRLHSIDLPDIHNIAHTKILEEQKKHPSEE